MARWGWLSAAAALLIALFVGSGCEPYQEPLPKRDRLNFPVGLALHPSGDYLYVVEVGKLQCSKIFPGNTEPTNLIVYEPGGAFGELALIHNDRRRATIICMQDCEFLKINKPDFDEILKKNYQREWNVRMEILQNHPLFQSLHSSFINYAVEGSSMVEYPSDTLIVKDLTIPQSKVYFLVKGECHVVQQVSLLESTENHTNIQLAIDSKKRRTSVYIPPDTSIPSILIRNPKFKQISYQPPKQRTTRWWVVYTLEPGEYFGIGEGHKGTSIVSKTRVDVLEISAAIFKKYDRRQIMCRMRNEVSLLYPTQQEALRSYLDAIRWNEYKQKVVTEAVEKGRTRRKIN